MKAKKSPKKARFNHIDPLITSRAIIAFLIILLAASIFALFRTYQQNIIMNNSFSLFMALTVVCMALLISLLFLINPSKARK